MIKERATLRKDCTLQVPPEVVEALGFVCGKGTVEFTILQGEDWDVNLVKDDEKIKVDQEDLKKLTKTLESSAKRGSLILLTGVER